MQHAALSGFDPATLARTFGPAAFAKGFQYAQQQAVVHAEWDPSEGALRGLVRGHGGKFYATAAFFSQTSGLPPEFELAECSCPVEFDCKHAVALILAAAAMAPAAAPHARPHRGPPAAGPGGSRARRRPRRPRSAPATPPPIPPAARPGPHRPGRVARQAEPRPRRSPPRYDRMGCAARSRVLVDAGLFRAAFLRTQRAPFGALGSPVIYAAFATGFAWM